MPNGGNTHVVERCPYCKSGHFDEIEIIRWLLFVNLLLPRYKCDRCNRLFYSPTQWIETEGKVYKSHNKHKHHKRMRATAVVFKGGKVLLVKDRGKHHYSLPGGGINRKESTAEAAKRELIEELGLRSEKIIRLRKCDFKGSVNKHKICLVETNGEPHIRGHELDSYIWWNMKDDISVFKHVRVIIGRVKRFV
jgi:hypothetical protein